jgi:hypothetical protein
MVPRWMALFDARAIQTNIVSRFRHLCHVLNECRGGLRIPAALLDKASPGRKTDPTGAFYLHRIWRQ